MGAIVLGGCGSGRSGEVMLRSEDFVGAGGVSDPLTTPTEVSKGPASVGASESRVGSVGGRVRLGAMDESARRDMEALAGTVEARVDGPRVLPSARATGEAALVDAKVGEINGRPVRLSELFERLQLGPRLQATAGEFRRSNRPRSTWVEATRSLTRQQLETLLTDELLEAEGRATLSEPQRAGLRNIIQELGEQGRRREGGRVAFQEQLAQQGTSEQQFLREEERRMLIDYQVQQRIRNRVRVSWKDVRLYYERNNERFNPPSTAVVRMVRVPKRDEAAATRVREALASGASFESVARGADNQFRREEGGVLPGELRLVELRESGPFDPKSRFGPANEAARGLEQGRVVGPIETQDRNEASRDLLWLTLDTVREVRRPLSDPGVQLEIIDTLTAERRVRERDLYLAQLTERASFTSLDDMVEAIVRAAGDRYWPVEPGAK